MADNDPISTREKFVEAWNKTMIDIWQEQQQKLKVFHFGNLYRSTMTLPIQEDGRFYNITLSQSFLEYGVWQDMGVGREIKHGNSGDLKVLDDSYREAHGLSTPKKRGPKWGGGYTSGNPRKKRRWFSKKYYSSVLALRDFMAESIGDEFKALVCDHLDMDKVKKSTKYYEKKGW